MRPPAWLLAAGMALSVAGPLQPAQAQEGLQPFQYIRSLQLAQDRIAAGDHAALPMQSKLLEMVDARLRAATTEEFKDPKNFRALLVYGMSGGNPATIRSVSSRLGLDEHDSAIVEGVLAYLGGNPAGAMQALDPVDPMALPADLGAFVALVKGSLLATEKPVEALALLDKARLLSPGTLVEEAALRRSVGIAVSQGDAARFALASTQYVERYLYSPYASQFADAFVSGVIGLHLSISQDKLADITSMMDAERERVIYLRIARRAAIDGLNDLSAFASTRAEKRPGPRDGAEDPRALLYASLSSVTSATVDDLHASLQKIDRNQLSASDRELLDAARAVAREMSAPPREAVRPPAAPPVPATQSAKALPAPVSDTAKPGQAGQSTSAEDDTAELPPVEGVASERPAEADAEQPAVETASSNLPPGQAAPADNDPADATIAEAKRKIDMIDQMLGGSPQ